MNLSLRVFVAAVLAFSVLGGGSAKAQGGDTIVVRTLQFSDITKRSGTWLFPPPGRYEKVLMQYTLKCDPATTQDRFNCGEWDYLTYTVLRDSSGEFDSTIMKQVNYMVRGVTPDTFAYASTFVANKRRYRTTTVQRAAQEDFITVGTGTQRNTAILKADGGKARYIWRASELTAAGLTAGPICGIKLTTSAAASGVLLFTIRIAQQQNATIGKILGQDNLTTVVRRDVNFAEGVNHVPFSTSFSWDGASDIVMEFSCWSAPASIGLSADGVTTGVVDDGSRRAYSFTAGDRIEVPGDIGTQLNDEITISYWCWGDPQKLPRAHNTMEAYDAQGRRVINIHAPWDNGTIYWDAGIDPVTGAVDRIEKNSIPENYAGKWNHYAFVKTKTGEMRIYINGVLFHSGNGKTLKMRNIERFVVGSGSSGSYEGYLDEFQVWNVALDDATINQWMTRKATDLHPKYTNLVLYYRGELDPSATRARDESVGGRDGVMFGLPTRERLSNDELGYLTQANTSRPTLQFETGNPSPTTARVDVDITLEPRRTSVVLFNNPTLPIIYALDNPRHPSLVTDTLTVQAAGVLPIYGEGGLKVDSIVVPPTTVLRKQERTYYSPIVDFEIGRYITPYGIGLDLGPNGFRWEYDVTDFAPLLRNNVTLSAGNQQELIDLTFVFIKGVPTRDVKQIDQVYYDRGAMFPAVLAGTALPPVTVPLNPDAKTFRLKAVTSGHDFSNETNCAEFCPRTHFLSVDGTERFSWLLWKECGDNPVFPQGGTWLIDRTGWCPGAPVDMYEFELTPFAVGKSAVTIDYGIKKQAPNEAWGRWEVATQLIGYGAPNHTKDAAIADIISPNNWEYYGRLNPICGSPVVVLENRGSDELTTCSIEYSINGNPPKTYSWTGRLGFLGKDTVLLPAPEWPAAPGLSTFTVRTVLASDQYPANDVRTTQFVMPPVYYNDLRITLRTNKQAEQQYEWRLRKTTGEIIGEGKNLASETTFTFDYTLQDGCYDFELVNKEGYGLDFWFLRSQLGTGSLSFSSGGNIIKTFQPDFGNRAWMQFSVAPKPTITSNTDSLIWSLPAPTRELRTLVVRSASSAPLRIDSVSIFSVRKHFFVESTSTPLPATLGPNDSLVVVVAFERPDAGSTSGSLRVFSNDERNSSLVVRLLGVVGTTSVAEAVENTLPIAADVVPQPAASAALVRVECFSATPLENTTIVVRNILGAEVHRLYSGVLVAGQQQFPIPSELPTGSYTVWIESGRFRSSVPFVIVR